MRTVLIILQATALTLFAVIGAQGEPGTVEKCPLTSAIAELSCGE